MKKNTIKSTGNKKLLPYIILLTGAFFVWQIIFSMYSLMNYVMLNIFWSKLFSLPLNVLPANLAFWAIQISLYLFFALAVWGTARLAGQALNLSWKNTSRLGFFLWGLSIVAILLANELSYPESIFATIMHILLSYNIAKALLITIAAILTAAVSLSVLRIGQVFWRSRVSIKIYSILGLTAFGLLAGGFIQRPVKEEQIQKSAHPNIIIIGLDALRPDRVGYYGSANKTPNLDKFLSNSTNFTNSLTPLARTFPSWSTILTGQYPKHSNIRFNLIDQTNLKLSSTLPAILRRHGYQTMYATDDRRFSNISEKFGFDKVLNIKQEGVNDFVLDAVNDFPLSNLLLNTRIGEFLFPYNFGNRASDATYKPSSFMVQTNQFLNKLNPNRPLFLSIHFCLPHWPYTWGTLREKPNLSNSELYNLAVEKVDQQFKNFLTMLRRHHILNNAIVIVISDHGEAFALRGDRLISRKNYITGKFSDKNIFNKMNALENKNQFLNVSTGHGTDALSFSQYHTVFAVHCFGDQKNAKQSVNNLVSLIDIKPTVLSMLNLASPDTDGNSLLPYIKGKKAAAHPRKIFIETGFTPTAIKSTKISVQNAFYEGINVFRVDPVTDRIVMDPNIAKNLISAKQRAVYYKNWVLAFYPMKNNQLIPILVNRKTGQWTDDLQTKFAKHSPAQKLLAQLKTFYGKEVLSAA